MPVWGRTREFACAERLLDGRRGLTFLEFGCLRNRDAVTGDGHSTVFLSDLAYRTGSHLYSCDISESAIVCAKEFLGPSASGITFICGDALDVANHWACYSKPIDFLLLDGCAEWPTKDPNAFEQAHKDVFLALENWLQPHSVVAVDDLSVRGGQVIPLMESKGWKNHTSGMTMAVMMRP